MYYLKGCWKSTSRSRWSVGTNLVNRTASGGWYLILSNQYRKKKILKSPVELPVPFVIWRILLVIVLMCTGYIVVHKVVFQLKVGWNQNMDRTRTPMDTATIMIHIKQLLLADKRLLFTLNVYDQNCYLIKKPSTKNCRNLEKRQWSDR